MNNPRPDEKSGLCDLAIANPICQINPLGRFLGPFMAGRRVRVQSRALGRMRRVRKAKEGV